MHFIGYTALRLFAGLFWLIPFPLVYRISNGVAFLLYKVLGYRKEVVESNLKRCFPEKEEEEIKRLAFESYKNLSDIILEVIKSMTTPLREIERRYRFTNPELINQYLSKGTSVLLCGSHYNNWEWGVQTVDRDLIAQSYGVYKPLRNKYIDNWYNHIRSRGGIELISMKRVIPHILEYQGTPEVYIFISDQSPSNHNYIHWVNFMGQETACPTGVDFLSRKYGYPVFHFQIDRIKRGFYSVTFTEVCLNPAEKKDGEITAAFMNNLEQAIRRKPENWLWSHKRWKIKRKKSEPGKVIAER